MTVHRESEEAFAHFFNSQSEDGPGAPGCTLAGQFRKGMAISARGVDEHHADSQTMAWSVNFIDHGPPPSTCNWLGSFQNGS